MKAWLSKFLKRFRKRAYPKTVKMELQPGANRIQFMRNGTVVADMVLVNITWDSNKETTVEFRDHTAFMDERTMHPVYKTMTMAGFKRLARGLDDGR